MNKIMYRALKLSRYQICHQILVSLNQQCVQSVRRFTVQDASTALRPFFFIVHPDLFGQHPTERAVNENSLKVLNEYLDGQSSFTRYNSQEVIFFIRSQGNSQDMKQIKITLITSKLHETVKGILNACGLSVSHLPPSAAVSGTDRPIDWHPSYYAATGQVNPQEVNRKKKPLVLSLRGWLRKNIENSRKLEESVRLIQDDIERLQEKLQRAIGIESIRFDSVWGFHHFRGCLKSFDRLYAAHPDFVHHVLKGHTLVFSNSTGVSRLGEIILSSEDVPQTWISLLQTVTAYNAVLARLPVMESKLSSLLNNIQVVRREKQHYHVMAEEYELLLNKILNSLRRCQEHVTATFGKKDLSGLHLAVEGESSPLTLSSTGQFLIPASCPGTLVVDFIFKNSPNAFRILKDIDRYLYDEEQSRKQAMEELNLTDLQKDESVTPTQMTSCCSRLVDQYWRFGVSLSKSRVRVSHYYSVMQDGLICLPWDWVGDDD